MASSSSSFSPMEMNKGGCVNWVELPPELTTSILHLLGAVEIVKTARKVCRSWRRLCKDPSTWSKIVMHSEEVGDRNYEKLCSHLVRRSQGGLVEIDISRFGTDPLLRYIADKSSRHLRILRISFCYQVTDGGLVAAVSRLPLLEELEVSHCSLSEECRLRVVGQSCPNLKTFKKNGSGFRGPRHEFDDVFALAIAETMPRLCHLELVGDRLSDVGLKAILNGCPNLEHLDLHKCFNVELVGDLETRCIERIKVVRRPNDSIHDHPSDARHVASAEGVVIMGR
ncbi:unnamed protein product [Eruca vesicaria subsp. sativa]|uniref:F-box domain-containing protein n=1 Tax=Eruca vesicaria subsp. sativa TaxID=29727 RepID=A0ABC8LJY7_ERUVS|nr:unnamed protein product [Eruca vesicaria subsp. sativa]